MIYQPPQLRRPSHNSNGAIFQCKFCIKPKNPERYNGPSPKYHDIHAFYAASWLSGLTNLVILYWSDSQKWLAVRLFEFSDRSFGSARGGLATIGECSVGD